MHFTYVHNDQNTKRKENGNYMYHNYIWWQKELILFQNYLIYAERRLADFYSSVTRTGIYFHNYFRCCRRRPCFPAGLHYLLTFPTRMSKISQKSMWLYANLSEKGRLYIAIYANSSKRENEWIVLTCGETHISQAFISNGNNRVSHKIIWVKVVIWTCSR